MCLHIVSMCKLKFIPPFMFVIYASAWACVWVCGITYNKWAPGEKWSDSSRGVIFVFRRSCARVILTCNKENTAGGNKSLCLRWSCFLFRLQTKLNYQKSHKKEVCGRMGGFMYWQLLTIVFKSHLPSLFFKVSAELLNTNILKCYTLTSQLSVWLHSTI